MQGPLDGETCYLFGCSLLHQGTTRNPKSRHERIIFFEPGATTNILHGIIINDALTIDVGVFCREIISAARDWLDSVMRLGQNYNAFVRRYPEGLPPYIVGVRVVS